MVQGLDHLPRTNMSNLKLLTRTDRLRPHPILEFSGYFSTMYSCLWAASKPVREVRGVHIPKLYISCKGLHSYGMIQRLTQYSGSPTPYHLIQECFHESIKFVQREFLYMGSNAKTLFCHWLFCFVGGSPAGSLKPCQVLNSFTICPRRTFPRLDK